MPKPKPSRNQMWIQQIVLVVRNGWETFENAKVFPFKLLRSGEELKAF